MRQINFKIWDKQTEKMHYDILTEMGECDNWDDDTSMWEVAYDLKKGDQERFVGLQFTGLYDKNGKEIYEGDILFSKTWGQHSRNKNPYHTVRWDRCGWVAQGYNGMFLVSPSLDVKEDFEIIGNIFESPELLNK